MDEVKNEEEDCFVEASFECFLKKDEESKCSEPSNSNFSPELSPSSVSELLQTTCSGLNLCLIQVEDYLVLQRKHFDLKVFEEPFRAIQLLVSLETWTFLPSL